MEGAMSDGVTDSQGHLRWPAEGRCGIRSLAVPAVEAPMTTGGLYGLSGPYRPRDADDCAPRARQRARRTPTPSGWPISNSAELGVHYIGAGSVLFRKCKV